jgi:hypothetical protein
MAGAFSLPPRANGAGKRHAAGIDQHDGAGAGAGHLDAGGSGVAVRPADSGDAQGWHRSGEDQGVGSCQLAADGPKAVWVADNYNHLHEQPTIFYALCVYSHLAGVVDGFSVGLAWAYVAIRILHSFIQVTTNFVPLRFVVFNIGSLVLMILAVVNVLGLFGVYTVGAQ